MIRAFWRWAGGAVAAGSLAVGVLGVRAGAQGVHGVEAAARSSSTEALALLDAAAVGYDAPEYTWLAGEVALGVADGATSASEALRSIDGAVERYLAMNAMTAGSAHALLGLSAAEQRLERADRAARTIDLASLSAGPWAQIGRHGRLAIGFLTLAVRREPTSSAAHDALLRLLLQYGLIEEAKVEAEAAARIAPAFEYHPDLDAGSLPREVVLAFARGARRGLDEAPLASRERKLFYLALLDERIGDRERAIEDLRAARAAPAGSVERAETSYHLGRILAAAGRSAEADTAWRDAEASPLFRGAVAVQRARVAETAGRTEEALAHLADARRSDPRSSELLLWESRLLRASGNRPPAIDDLRWGIQIDPGNRALRSALVEVLIEDGQSGEAARVLADFTSALGEGDDTRRLAGLLGAR